MEYHESRASQDQQMIRDSRSGVMQLKASVIPLNLTRNVEAKIEKSKSMRFKVFKEIYRQHRVH